MAEDLRSLNGLDVEQHPRELGRRCHHGVVRGRDLLPGPSLLPAHPMPRGFQRSIDRVSAVDVGARPVIPNSMIEPQRALVCAHRSRSSATPQANGPTVPITTASTNTRNVRSRHSSSRNRDTRRPSDVRASLKSDELRHVAAPLVRAIPHCATGRPARSVESRKRNMLGRSRLQIWWSQVFPSVRSCGNRGGHFCQGGTSSANVA